MPCDQTLLEEAVARMERSLLEAQEAVHAKDAAALERASAAHSEILARIRKALSAPGLLESNPAEIESLLARLLSQVRAVSEQIGAWRQDLACGMNELRLERTRLIALAEASARGATPREAAPGD